MSDPPAKQGLIPFPIPSIDTPCFTFYKIVGDLSCESPPLIVLHGGPGTGHEYLLPFGALWQQYGIPVIFYDQIGCAASTRLPQTAGDATFWRGDLFVAELDNLIDSLQIRKGYHILGQSFGGIIAVEYATRRPEGLRRLVLASALASRPLSVESAKIRRDELPVETRQLLEELDQKGERDSPAFQSAMVVFYKHCLVRQGPFPPEEMKLTMKHMSEDTTVRQTVTGPSPLLTVPGSMKDWTSIPRLSKITSPTLAYNGEYDTSHDIATVPFFDHIPRVRWITFPNAGHMVHLEDKGTREKVLRLVGDFLLQDDPTW